MNLMFYNFNDFNNKSTVNIVRRPTAGAEKNKRRQLLDCNI